MFLLFSWLLAAARAARARSGTRAGARAGGRAGAGAGARAARARPRAGRRVGRTARAGAWLSQHQQHADCIYYMRFVAFSFESFDNWLHFASGKYQQ